MTAAESTAKVVESQRLSSASRRPLLWPPMAMASTGPRIEGRLRPQVAMQPQVSRPQQAQLAATSSRSLLCDSSAGGCSSAQYEEGAGLTPVMDAPCPVWQGQQEERCSPEEPAVDGEHFWGL